MLWYDIEKGETNGTVQCGNMVRQWKEGYVADLINKRFVPSPEGASSGIIDLDSQGRRWEGMKRNNRPFGYGILYDECGSKLFEGFMVNDKRVCWGVEYYSDLSVVKYRGSYCNDQKCGYGVLWNRTRTIEFEGFFCCNKPLWEGYAFGMVHSHMERLILPSSSLLLEAKSFNLPSALIRLRHLQIDKDCLVNVAEFTLDGLPSLETLSVDERSFTCNVEDVRRVDGACHVTHCPSLQSIVFLPFSFRDYRELHLTHLPALLSLHIDHSCFFHGQLLSIIGAYLVRFSHCQIVRLSAASM